VTRTADQATEHLPDRPRQELSQETTVLTGPSIFSGLLGTDGLARPCGASEGPYANRPMAALVLHINREVIHHGAEVALLRDLYLRRTTS
jgi:hypothetical protein